MNESNKVAVFEPFDEDDETLMLGAIQASGEFFSGLCAALELLTAAGDPSKIPEHTAIPTECLPLVYSLLRTQLIAHGIVDVGTPRPGIFRRVVTEERLEAARKRKNAEAVLHQMVTQSAVAH